MFARHNFQIEEVVSDSDDQHLATEPRRLPSTETTPGEATRSDLTSPKDTRDYPELLRK